MRYTHFGIGHSAMLWRIAQGSLSSHSIVRVNTMDVISIEEDAASGDEGDDDVECLEECEDEPEDDDAKSFDSEECDDDLSDGELDDEDDEGCVDEKDEFDEVCC
jgi:hypothetical protein